MKIRLTNTVQVRAQRGMTLIELMVAMLLGLILTAGAIQIFIGNRATYAFNEGLSRIQEHGRFALEHIAQTSRMAGYLGCLRDITVYNNLNGANDFRDDLANGIMGYNFNGTGTGQLYAATAVNPAPLASGASWTPNLPAQLNNLVIPGSDVLVVRAVGGEGPTLIPPFSNSAQLFVAPGHGFALGEILVVTDCQKASIFQLTNSQATGFGVNLVHSNAGSFSPGNTSPNWGSEQSYGLGSEVARLQTFAFYVGRGASGAPSLFQLRLQGTSATASGFVAEELVEGIDSLQVRYGLDTDGSGTVNGWFTADGVGDWSTVLSVEISLLARATEEYGLDEDATVYNVGGVRFDPVDDRRFRQVFSTTIGLRNRLP